MTSDPVKFGCLALWVAGADPGFAASDDSIQVYSHPLNLLVLLAAVLVLIAGIYGSAHLVRLAVGFVQHRRICKVDAVLRTNGHQFGGHVTILGLNGARFEHGDHASQRRFLALLAGKTFNDFDLDINGVSRPVFVDGFHVFYSPLYFYDQITRDDLHDILKGSSVEPQLAAHIGHVTTRRKWQDDIARRKQKIEAAKVTRRLQPKAEH